MNILKIVFFKSLLRHSSEIHSLLLLSKPALLILTTLCVLCWRKGVTWHSNWWTKMAKLVHITHSCYKKYVPKLVSDNHGKFSFLWLYHLETSFWYMLASGCCPIVRCLLTVTNIFGSEINHMISSNLMNGTRSKEIVEDKKKIF